MSYRLDDNLEFYTRFAYAFVNNASGSVPRFSIRDAATSYVLRVHWSYQPTPGPFSAYFLGATQPTITQNQFFPSGWSVFEIHFRYTTQSLPDNFEMHRNGVTIMTYDGATKPTNGAPSLGFVEYGSQPSSYNTLDDIAINDTSGATDNSWCGDGHVVAVHPSGNGDSSGWMGSDGNNVNNFALVSEAGTPNRTNFVESDTSGQRDLYQATDLALKPNDSIRRVYTWADARKLLADNSPLELGLKVGGTEHWTPPQELELDWRGYLGQGGGAISNFFHLN